MMPLLASDVILYRRQQRRTHRESAVAILPFKLPVADSFMHPGRRSALYVAHDVGQFVSGEQTEQKVNMIGHTTHFFRYDVQRARRATKVGVQPFTPFRRDERT